MLLSASVVVVALSFSAIQGSYLPHLTSHPHQLSKSHYIRDVHGMYLRSVSSDPWSRALGSIQQCKKICPYCLPIFSVDQSSKLLQSHFGLRAYIFHESFSETMKNFLPHVYETSPYGAEHPSCYTIAFLGLPPQQREGGVHHSTTRNNPNFAKDDSNTTFWEVIDPVALQLTEDQRLRFAKAMTVLDLKPHFPMTQLEPLIDPALGDQALSALAKTKLPIRPAKVNDPARLEWLKTMERILEEVLKGKSKGS